MTPTEQDRGYSERDLDLYEEDPGGLGPAAETEPIPDPRVAPAGTGDGVPRVEELQQKISALDDSLMRVRADMQNALRRANQERTEAIRYANADLMRALIPVIDDFERALEAAQDNDNSEALVAGVRLVHQNLLKALREKGLEPIDAENQPFDPHLHEAMMRKPVADQAPGTVVEELARGYRLGERTIRPARVVVAAPVE